MPLGPSQPAVQLSDSDVDDDDQMVEEDEEEEVEKDVEEEEPEEEEQESEEEEEEEDDVEEEEVGRIEADDKHKDVRQDVKSEERYGHLELGPSTQGKFRDMLPSNAYVVEQSSFGSKLSGPSKETLNIQSEGLRIKSGRYLSLGKNKGILLDNKKDAQTLIEKSSSKSCIEHHSNSNSYLCKSEIMSPQTTNSCHVTGKGVDVAIKMRDCFGKEANDVLDPEDEIKQKDKQSGDDKKRTASRLASEIGSQSLSPGAGIDNGDKRPAIICDFFAKGWCIKGSTCRFLHRKDNLYNTHAQHEGEVFAANRKDVQLDEGVRDSTERSRSPSFHDPIAPLVGTNPAIPLHLTSEGIQKLERIVSERSIQFPEERDCFALRKEILSVGTSPDARQMASASSYPVFRPLFEDIERESKSQHWPANDCGSHLLLANRGGSVSRNSLHPEYGFSSSGYTITADKYSIGKPSSHSSSLAELASIHSCHPSLSHSPNSSSSNHLLSTGIPSRNSIPAWSGFPLPFSYSSLQASSLRLSSFLRSSPISHSELDNLPSTSISLPSAELKPKISSDDWEPSVPFRPSFFIPLAISSPRSQYNPLHDSFELPKLGDVSLKAFYSQGSSKVNTYYPQTFGDPVTGTIGLSSNEDINSVSSHNIRSENVLDKSCHTHEKNMPENEAKALGMSVGSQNEALSKEENALDLSDVEDNINMNKISEHCDGRKQRDGSRKVKDLVDRVGQNKEEEVDGIMGENIHKESKAMRHFRASLVDLVKELLKPKWRDGSLRKDAHNKIVRKAVEKVLGSLQHHQIPSTTESVKQYLSSSRLKINKLVEGYADKYGKT